MNRKNLLAIKKTATLKNTILFGLLLLVMGFFIMPEATSQIKQYAHETDIIDGLFYYSPEQLYDMIAAYGKKGRQLYIAVELTADLVFSIVIAAFFSSLLIWSGAKSGNKVIKINYLFFLPALSMISNWLENGGIVWMLARYPEKYFYLALATSFFTFSKWILLLLCLFIAVWNLLRIIFIKFHFFQNTQESTMADSN